MHPFVRTRTASAPTAVRRRQRWLGHPTSTPSSGCGTKAWAGRCTIPFTLGIGPTSTLEQKRAYLEEYANNIIAKLRR